MKKTIKKIFSKIKPIRLWLRHYKINKQEYERGVIFKNLRSKFINFYFMLVLTKKKYQQFIEICIHDYDDIYNNQIPNYLYQPLSLQLQEMYSRGNNKEIKRIFSTILKESDKEKYSLNKDSILDCILTLSTGNKSFSDRSFPYLFIKSKKIKKYFSQIKISVESVGDSFFKIIFYCYFNDNFSYKLWLASTTHFLPEVILKYRFHKKLLINKTSALKSKKLSIANYEQKAYFLIRNYLKKITKGIFFTVLEDYPCTLVSSLTNIQTVLFGGLNNKPKTSSFFDAIIDSSSEHNSRYISTRGSIFIPISNIQQGFNIVYMKHFKDDYYHFPTTSELSWFTILYYLLYHQLNCLINIKNQSYTYDISKYKIDFEKERKKINTISSIISIVKSQYDYQISHAYSLNLSEEYYDLDNTNSEYTNFYKTQIDYLFSRINSEMEKVNKIYEIRYSITNNKKNIWLQRMAVVLMIVSIVIPIVQYILNIKQSSKDFNNKKQLIENLNKQLDDSFNHLEKNIKQENDNQNQVLDKNFEELIKELNKIIEKQEMKKEPSL